MTKEQYNNSEKDSSVDPGGISLRSLIWTIAILVFLEWVATLSYLRFVRIHVLSSSFSGPGLSAQWLLSIYPVLSALFLLEMIAVIWIHRKSRPINIGPKPMRTEAFAKNALLGLGTGLLVSVAVYPLISHSATARMFVRIVLAGPSDVLTALLLFAMVCVLPPLSEIVFRGIIMKSLLRHADPVVSITISSFVFAFLWPGYGFWVGLILGIAASVLYLRTRSLVACAFANGTTTVVAGTYLVCHALKLLP